MSTAAEHANMNNLTIRLWWNVMHSFRMCTRWKKSILDVLLYLIIILLLVWLRTRILYNLLHLYFSNHLWKSLNDICFTCSCSPSPRSHLMKVLALRLWLRWHNMPAKNGSTQGSVMGITAHSLKPWVYFRVWLDKTGLASQWIYRHSNSEAGSFAPFDIWNVYKSPSVLW